MVAPAVYQTKLAKTEATIAARAVEVFAQYRSWRFAHRKADGHPFFIMDGSPVKQSDGTMDQPVYYVDLHDCTCPSHRDGHMACKHMRAVRLWFNAVKAGEITIPRRMTARDRDVMEAAHAENEAMDVAESADALLDAYHREQARRRAAAYAEPEQDWWQTADGGIVWLQPGDSYGPDTEGLSEVGQPAPAAPTVPTSVRMAGLSEVWPACQAAGCTDDTEPHERFCRRHVLVDAF